MMEVGRGYIVEATEVYCGQDSCDYICLLQVTQLCHR